MKQKPGGHGLSAAGMKVALIAARFNDGIVSKMLRGAEETLRELGASEEQILSVRVPGAFELPLAANALARSGQFDGIVALGAVIRGETPHFDFVAGECAAGLNRVQLDYGLPVGFGVITTDTVEHAQARAGGSAGNKGEEAALAVIEMIAFLREHKHNV